MSDTLQFDLVSPERKLASLAADMVELPGMDGGLAAMPNHTPVLTTLRPGIVRVHQGGTVTEYVVTGGFAEISETSTSVLAEGAMDRKDISAAQIDALVEEAQAGISGAEELVQTALNQRINDLGSLKADLGL